MASLYTLSCSRPESTRLLTLTSVIASLTCSGVTDFDPVEVLPGAETTPALIRVLTRLVIVGIEGTEALVTVGGGI